MQTDRPALVALDWGTTSLRAFLMGGARVFESRQSDDGIQALAAEGPVGFERAFAALAGAWLQQWPALPVVACGMVGSAQGWREAPYANCPVDAFALGTQGATVTSASGHEILIAPGLRFDAPRGAPDVMRGEETQVAGALLQQSAWSARARIVLPGTHSKWVEVAEGRIVGFATYMTGELFALLKAHSILARLMKPAQAVDAEFTAAAFARGLDDARASRPGELLHQLFATRTLGLTAQLPHVALADYLSGLLIGHELVAALGGLDGNEGAPGAPLVLVGEAGLCARYASALQHVGRPAQAVLGNTAPQGLWALAQRAGLLAA